MNEEASPGRLIELLLCLSVSLRLGGHRNIRRAYSFN